MSVVWDFLNSLWGILVASLLILFYHWYKRPKNFPPGPRGIPLLGTVPFLGKFPERTLKKWSQNYGPVMSVRFGTRDLVVIHNFDYLQQAFVRQGAQFSGRPESPFINQVTNGLGLIFTQYNDFHKTQKKFGLATLRGFGVGKRSMESKVLEEVSCLLNAIEEKNGKPFNIKVLLHNSVSNVTSMISLGKRFDYDDTAFRDVLYRHQAKFTDPVYNAFMMAFQLAPTLMNIWPFSTYNRVIVDDLQAALDLLKEIIAEHQQSFDKTELRDFIDAYLLEIENSTDKSFNFLQLIHCVRDLFEAGSDTTANTINWGILCLIVYPEVQEKMRKEIMNVIGSGQISMQDRNEMPYTCAVIEEILRFRTLAPLSLLHSTTEDAVLGKYLIPKGTMVAGNFWAVHNDEAVWENPEIFNPDRFINENSEFVHSSHVLPFSLGPRRCMGEPLARMEIFIFLVSLIRQYEFVPDPSSEKPDVENACSGLLFVAKAYNLIARPV